VYLVSEVELETRTNVVPSALHEREIAVQNEQNVADAEPEVVCISTNYIYNLFFYSRGYLAGFAVFCRSQASRVFYRFIGYLSFSLFHLLFFVRTNLWNSPRLFGHILDGPHIKYCSCYNRELIVHVKALYGQPTSIVALSSLW
jgi:hypothetical protein